MLFHVSAPGLPRHAVLASGRWGATIRSLGGKHVHHAREELLEMVRASVAPSAPSRWACLFALDDRGSALAYRANFEEPAAIYLVEPIYDHAGVRTSKHDMQWIRDLAVGHPSPPPPSVLLQRLKSYWLGEPSESPVWETLVSGAVTVLAVVG